MLAVISASQVRAQATANAVRSAADAFGVTAGDESIGVYDETSVRGFDLEAAGNYRMNGTYFVKSSGVSNFFLESRIVRIGYNTLNSSLPGPSGLVDYQLRDPRKDEPSLLTLGLDVFRQPYAELLVKHRAADDRLSIAAGAGAVFRLADEQGGDGSSWIVAGTLRASVGSSTWRLFGGEYDYRRDGPFRFVAEADALPEHVERGHYLGQPWARKYGERRIAGLLGDAPLSSRLGIGGTLIFSQEDPSRSVTQIIGDYRSDGTVGGFIAVTPHQRTTAWSGELRAHWQGGTADWQHRFDATVRGRRSRSRFGGSVIVDPGRTPFGEEFDEIPEPDVSASANARDSVDQTGIGLTYRLAFQGHLQLNAGVLRTSYRKRFQSASGQQRSLNSAPWLYNVGGAVRFAPGLQFYASYSRGLEEAGVAPETASNRNAVLDPVIVRQRELGFRYTPTDKLILVIAGFDTRKPYSGIDPASNAYGFLGQVRHRGIEASLSGQANRSLSIVMGGMLLQPRLSGEAVDIGFLGNRPVGVPKVRGVLGLDFRVEAVPGLSLDLKTVYSGASPARSRLTGATGQLMVDSSHTLDIGLRYGFQLARHKATARAQIQNVFNSYDWLVNSSETLVYSPQRRAKIVLTTEF